MGEDPENIFMQYLNASTNQDLAALEQLIHDDYHYDPRYHVMGLTGGGMSKKKLLKHLAESEFPNISAECRDIETIVQGNRIAFCYNVEFTDKISGKQFTYPFSGMMELRDDQIYRTFFMTDRLAHLLNTREVVFSPDEKKTLANYMHYLMDKGIIEMSK